MPRNRRVAQPVDPNEEKDYLIGELYYDEDKGFRGFNDTFRLLKGKGITKKYLEGWFSRNVEKNKIEGKGKNSYVAKHPRQEYQLDFFYMTDKQFVGQFYKFGLSVIDIFSKKATVIALENNSTDDLIQGLKEAFEDLEENQKLYTQTLMGLHKLDMRSFAKMKVYSG